MSDVCFRSYRYRLVPTDEQAQLMLRQAGARRWAWNWGLSKRRAHYQNTGRLLPLSAMQKELTAVKRLPETAWLADTDSQVPQQALLDLDRAYAAFLAKRARFPRFKSRKRDRATFRYPQRVKVDRDRVYLPKVGWVVLRMSRELPGPVRSATVTRDPPGYWFISLTVEVLPFVGPTPVISPEKVVGIDRGLKALIVTSDAQVVDPPRFLVRSLHRLARAQRHLTRTQKGSRGYHKARRRLALLHRRVADQRLDFTHKITTRLVAEHHALAIEDLNVRGLVRRKLARAIYDAGWGAIGQQLAYKSAYSRKPFIVVNRWFPSSKACSACGLTVAHLPLSVRRWVCPACFVEHDRDVNAAMNLRTWALKELGLVAAGHADTLNAGRAAVRPDAVGRAA